MARIDGYGSASDPRKLRENRSLPEIPAVEHGDAVGLDTEQLAPKALRETEYSVDEEFAGRPALQAGHFTRRLTV